MERKTVSLFSPLALYNFVSALAWCFVLINALLLYSKYGQPTAYEYTKDLLTYVQCGSIIEIFNSLFGIVRSPLLTTAAQVLSRLLVVLGIFQFVPEAPGSKSTAYITLLLAWCITEVVRYLFYFFNLTRQAGPPRFILILRYNLFLVLYPSGVASELYIIYSALPLAEELYGPWARYFLIGSMLTYIPGLPMLFLHMVSQRRKVMKTLREAAVKKTAKED